MKFEDWLRSNPPPDFAAFLARHREPDDALRLYIPPEAWADWEREVKAWAARYRFRHEER